MKRLGVILIVGGALFAVVSFVDGLPGLGIGGLLLLGVPGALVLVAGIRSDERPMPAFTRQTPNVGERLDRATSQLEKGRFTAAIGTAWEGDRIARLVFDARGTVGPHSYSQWDMNPPEGGGRA